MIRWQRPTRRRIGVFDIAVAVWALGLGVCALALYRAFNP